MLERGSSAFACASSRPARERRHRDHERDTDREPEHGQDRAALAPHELAPQVAEEEHRAIEAAAPESHLCVRSAGRDHVRRATASEASAPSPGSTASGRGHPAAEVLEPPAPSPRSANRGTGSGSPSPKCSTIMNSIGSHIIRPWPRFTSHDRARLHRLREPRRDADARRGHGGTPRCDLARTRCCPRGLARASGSRGAASTLEAAARQLDEYFAGTRTVVRPPARPPRARRSSSPPGARSPRSPTARRARTPSRRRGSAGRPPCGPSAPRTAATRSRSCSPATG